MVPLARTQLLSVREVDDGLVVYDLATNGVHSLNPTTAFVWGACDGAATVDDVARDLAGVLGPDCGAADLRALVWLALHELDEVGLVEYVPTPPGGARVSRRDAAKRLARAAILVGGIVPVVRTIVAPAAAEVGSAVRPPTGKCVVTGASGASGGRCTPGTPACTGTCQPSEREGGQVIACACV